MIDADKYYEKEFTVGWGIAGSFLFSIRRTANSLKCNLKITPPFLSLSPLNRINIKATGGDINGFIKFMEEHEQVYNVEYE